MMSHLCQSEDRESVCGQRGEIDRETETEREEERETERKDREIDVGDRESRKGKRLTC
jgi:hypothetical protein